MAALRLENLGKAFPGKRGTPPVKAVAGLSLEVQAGECVALLGPSGAGKSTLLRLIAGLEAPDHGEIKLGGSSILHQKPGERHISMAFQNPALLPQLTVRENLGLSAKLRGGPADDLPQTAELLGLTQLLDRKPETLSGGEQQRAALARALFARPSLLLLDEPLANLDPISRLDLRETIRRLQRDLKVTTLYVTHDQTEAAEIADRIAILRSGCLEQFATPSDLYHHPANLFVARFYGPDPLNVLRGKLIASHVDLGCAKIPLDRSVNIPEGDELLIAFRRSAVTATRSANPAWTLREMRSLGWTRTLQLELGPHQIICTTNDPGMLPGHQVQIHIPADAIHLFTTGGLAL